MMNEKLAITAEQAQEALDVHTGAHLCAGGLRFRGDERRPCLPYRLAAAYLSEHAEVIALREQVQRVEELRDDWRSRAALPDLGRPELIGSGPRERAREVLTTCADRLTAALAGERASDAPERGGEHNHDAIGVYGGCPACAAAHGLSRPEQSGGAR